MDPASAFGIVTGAMQTVQIIGSTLQGLRALQGKYADADMTIHSLIVQAATIKSAITQLQEWASYDSARAEHPDYLDGLDIAIDGCKTSMECLLAQVSKVTSVLDGREVPELRVAAKLRAVWDDHLMQDYQQRLQSQVLALNFLLQVCQCRTVTEQVELLRREENRQLLKKVEDDTATLRSSVRQRGNPSAMSISQSTISETALDVDDIIVNATAYRRVLAHNRSVSNRARTEESSHNTGTQPQTPRSTTTDEGYASGTVRSQSFNGSNTLSAPSTFLEPPAESVPPQGKGDMGRSSSMAVSQTSAKPTTPAMRRWQSNPIPLHKSGSKREKIRQVLGRLDTSSRSSLKKTSPRLGTKPFSSFSPIPERGAAPRFDRSRPNTSIDLSSTDSVAIPPIIKAAQTGSLVQVEMQIGEGADINDHHALTGRTALAVAAHCGNEEVVDYLLQQGAKFDTQEIDGSTPLHLAASRGHTGVIQVLLSVIESVDVKDGLGRTPFWVAADGGHIDATRMLLGAGCKITARAKGQITALHKAAIRGDSEMVAFLLQSGADIEAKDATMKSALHHACENRQYTLCRSLFQYKADIEAVEINKKTPLICAAIAGDVRIVEYLIGKRASMLTTDEGGMNPLHAAAAHGHVEVVQFLLEKKVSISSTNKLGMTPLHLAVMSRQFAVVEFLLRRGAPTEIKSSGGFTPLHYACDLVDVEIAQHLVGCGASIEAQGEGQQRPIHIAVARNSMELVQFLCQRRVEVDAADASGTRPLCIACRKGNAPIAELLLDQGALTLCPTSWNGTREEHSPLAIASRSGDVRIVSLLLGKGASVEQYDGRGWNPPLYAAHYGHVQALRLLLSKCSTLAKIKLGQMFSQTRFHPDISIPSETAHMIQRLILENAQPLHGQGIGGPRVMRDFSGGFGGDSRLLQGQVHVQQAFYQPPSSSITPPIPSFPQTAIELPAFEPIILPGREINESIESGNQGTQQRQSMAEATTRPGLFEAPQDPVTQDNSHNNHVSIEQTYDNYNHQTSARSGPREPLPTIPSRTNTPLPIFEYPRHEPPSQPVSQPQDLPPRNFPTRGDIRPSPFDTSSGNVAISPAHLEPGELPDNRQPQYIGGLDRQVPEDESDSDFESDSDSESAVSVYTAPESLEPEVSELSSAGLGAAIYELDGTSISMHGVFI
ncbi:ankyrin repeat domain-containing protein 28 [Nannizzia gypsea CBS 118893]|uniref:Ankyrin repeat domain-containing protein 28 n=1 Tax=Arthroderma gypseum (strain ATCC MYA-4604 / CBS 118893) TaxID=535722 RepID=E4UMZ9_ARTGP|nr:ankyrin repeat domain-containing protein 28 [Nannizzia gypsea CBS 118893]EFQ99513.1 ankyrin repeat domain-containing protein 28 [Nannizzia gypsea CBS 118893]